MTVEVRALDADEVQARLTDLARLRITVFRAWPYLYDGDTDYEARYLSAFATAPGATLVAAVAGREIVGMATASPMAAQEAAIREPVAAHGIDPDVTWYFGESVLLPRWHGRGVGHRFFDLREAAARRAGARAAMFCAVIREDKDPRRPAGARDLHPFWIARGYAPVPGLACRMRWREVGERDESDHRLQFWRRPF
ncbi:GNAT family N-acetyltransferase [Sphingomonas sp.]|uniref:GNAT family N-acetyltransferase n=1 Tax=Sphingomonas sp. TaxID=28214 RepID=UPI001EC23ABD|nr:GNAT family N-acetyltransferase [Sphingomonas sp.]MBX3592946.1 GNAT family N-acetyltransferase [Sphingomonas sp.]